MKALRICCYLISFFLPIYAVANDTSATVAAGGIEFKKSDQISMDEELLKISLDEIEVDYKFTNHSTKKIESLVAFPLPPAPYKNFHFEEVYPEWDESNWAYEFNENHTIYDHPQTLHERIKNTPFVNFNMKVDNQEGYVKTKVRALDAKGNDITALLRQNQIPLSATYLYGYGGGETRIKPNSLLEKKLTSLKLLNSNGEPNWKTQTIYYWNQTFEPQKQITTQHTYRPGVGGNWLDYGNAKQWSDLRLEPPMSWKDYIVDENSKKQMLKAIKAAKKLGATSWKVLEVQYILTTGANWQGAIKKFRLEVSPPNRSTLVLCNWPGKVKHQKNGIYSVSLTNFKPQQDLKVLFVGLVYTKNDNGIMLT